MIQKRKKLGDLLVEATVISEQQLMDALQKQKNTGYRLGDQLIAMNLVSEQADYRSIRISTWNSTY